MRPFRLLPALLSGIFIVCPISTRANDFAVMVLHAVAASPSQSCNHPEIASFDCRSPATVSVGVGEAVDVFLLLHEVTTIRGAQVRFDWPLTWVFQSWHQACQSNPLAAVVPNESSGELAVAFDAVTGGSRAVPIGWLTLATGVSGCLEIGESTKPHGTHIVDGLATPIPVPPERRGSVCVGAGGRDGCSLGISLDGASWGGIKEHYRD